MPTVRTLLLLLAMVSAEPSEEALPLCGSDPAGDESGKWIAQAFRGDAVGLNHPTPKYQCRGNDMHASFERTSCRTLSGTEAVERLENSGHRLFLVGDSVQHQLFHGILSHYDRSFTDGNNKRRLPFVAGWRCGWRTDEEADGLFGDLLARVAAMKEKENKNGVLLINLGLWYNLRCSSTSSCGFTDPVPAVLGAWRAGDEEALEPDPASREVDGAEAWRSTKCCGLPRKHLCEKRRKFIFSKEGPEMMYAKDLLRLARYIAAHRSELPKHVFWIDTLPQHFGDTGTFAKESFGANPDWVADPEEPTACRAPSPGAKSLQTWRNDIARRIFRAVAPSVRQVSTQEMLLSRGAHDHALEHDCTHWCQSSPGFQEHVRCVLTAVVKAVEEGSAHAEARASPCDDTDAVYFVKTGGERCSAETQLLSEAECRQAFEALRESEGLNLFASHGTRATHYPNGCSVWQGTEETGRALTWNGNLRGADNNKHALVCACPTSEREVDDDDWEMPPRRRLRGARVSVEWR